MLQKKLAWWLDDQAKLTSFVAKLEYEKKVESLILVDAIPLGKDACVVD